MTDAQDALSTPRASRAQSLFVFSFFSCFHSKTHSFFDISILSGYKRIDLEVKAACNWFFVEMKPFKWNYAHDWFGEQLGPELLKSPEVLTTMMAKGHQNDNCQSSDLFLSSEAKAFPEVIREAVPSATHTEGSLLVSIFKGKRRHCAWGRLATEGSGL